MSTSNTSSRRPPRTRRPRPVRGPQSASSRRKQDEVALIDRRILSSAEKKFFNPGQSLAVTASFQYSDILALNQGITDSDRIGDAFKVINDLQITYTITKNAASTLYTDFFRLVIFQWYPSTTANTPTDAQLWLNDPATSTVTLRSYESHDFGRKGKAPLFRILYSETTAINGLPAAPTSSIGCIIERTVKLAPMRRQIQYSAGTTSGSNLIYIAWISTTATAPLAVNFNAMFDYVDF